MDVETLRALFVKPLAGFRAATFKRAGGAALTLNDAYLISQIIGSVAVILSLIAVIISIRQNTRAQRTAAVQSLTAAVAAINVPGMTAPEMGLALSSACRDWASASRNERILAHYFLFSFFKLCEQAWYQHQADALDADQWKGWESSILRFYHSPGVKDGWWPNRYVAFSPAFQAFLSCSTEPRTHAGASLYALFEGAPSPSPAPAKC